LKDRLQA